MIIPGPNPTFTPGIVEFSAAEFLALYPQFTPQSQYLANNFAVATMLLNNTLRSVVQDANQRQTLLYLLTCHVTKLFNGEAATPATGLVGRVSDATMGSVSATAEYLSTSGPNAAYFLQTSYGTAFWTMTAQYRTMRYMAPPQRSYSPWGWGDGGCNPQGW